LGSLGMRMFGLFRGHYWHFDVFHCHMYVCPFEAIFEYFSCFGLLYKEKSCNPGVESKGSCLVWKFSCQGWPLVAGSKFFYRGRNISVWGMKVFTRNKTRKFLHLWALE
jgi:hypothetical protein